MLDNRTAVVIGGTSGIGEAVAKAARAAGARVVVGSRRSDPPVDVADEKSVERFLEKVGTFDHLVVSVLAPSVPPRAASQKTARLRSSAESARTAPAAGNVIMTAFNLALVPIAEVAALELAPVGKGRRRLA